MSFASLLLTLIAAALTMGCLLARSGHHLLNSSALSVRWKRRLHRSVRVSFTALLLGLLPPLVIIIANPPASGRDDPLLWVCAVGFYGGAGVALTGFAILLGVAGWFACLQWKTLGYQAVEEVYLIVACLRKYAFHTSQLEPDQPAARESFASDYFDYVLIANSMHEGRCSLEPPDSVD